MKILTARLLFCKLLKQFHHHQSSSTCWSGTCTYGWVAAAGAGAPSQRILRREAPPRAEAEGALSCLLGVLRMQCFWLLWLQFLLTVSFVPLFNIKAVSCAGTIFSHCSLIQPPFPCLPLFHALFFWVCFDCVRCPGVHAGGRRRCGNRCVKHLLIISYALSIFFKWSSEWVLYTTFSDTFNIIFFKFYNFSCNVF